MKRRYILDSSAVLALLQQEPGCRIVGPVTRQAIMSSVNHCEVLLLLTRRQVPMEDAVSIFDSLGIEICPFDGNSAIATALTLPAIRHLSLGDRCCLALGTEKQLPVVTADRTWSAFESRADILQIRGENAVASL